MTRADMRLKLLEQMVLDRDAKLAVAIPHADYLALSEKCAKLGELLRATCGRDFQFYGAYRNSVMRDVNLALSQ